MSNSSTFKTSSKTKRRKLRKRVAESRFLLDSYPTNSKTPVYLNLATSIGTVFSNQGAEMLSELRELLDSARISSFAIMAPGTWSNPRVRNRLKEMFHEKGFGWAWNYVFFPLKTENTQKFILRIIKTLEITHYFDANKSFLLKVIYEKKLTSVKLWWMDVNSSEKTLKGWSAVRVWFTKTSPRYWSPVPLGDDATQLIQTGYTKYEEV